MKVLAPAKRAAGCDVKVRLEYVGNGVDIVGAIKDSKIIIAVGKNPEVPILALADYGMADDRLGLAPQLAAVL
ncbi:hypothetical protein [Noviherbaspirillum galbum]|uniref:Uncharacterized protein n=1 Tax=Noviherbaspirillum galbum TaxID=2709383 RepID=A0A6B3SZ51_9BURK|nr:hypothetical protein [Noviherbaspirillum galbum]NEX63669.1 hypothetical protein [Noviherbaspirillum galbum]